jgi:DNA-binding helix-hairpin-helix protein with protein kinase domain
MKGNFHVPFWSRAEVATPRLRQQSFARLHRAGWSVGDVRILTAAGPA